jgi:hypothetical protein
MAIPPGSKAFFDALSCYGSAPTAVTSATLTSSLTVSLRRNRVALPATVPSSEQEVREQLLACGRSTPNISVEPTERIVGASETARLLEEISGATSGDSRFALAARLASILRLGPDAVQEVRAALLGGEIDPDVSSVLVHALERADTPGAQSILVEVVESRDTSRDSKLQALVLEALAADANAAVRSAAAGALHLLPTSPRAEAVIIRRLGTERDSETRLRMVRYLSTHSAMFSQASGALRRLLSRQHSRDVYEAAAEALASIEHPDPAH